MSGYNKAISKDERVKADWAGVTEPAEYFEIEESVKAVPNVQF